MSARSSTTLAATAIASILLCLPSAVAGEGSARLDDAKATLVQLAAWFESLPLNERAAAAREFRRWLAETYGDDVPFPFELPGEEEIAAWDAPVPTADEPGQRAEVNQVGSMDEPSPAEEAADETPTAKRVDRAVATDKMPLPKTPPTPGRCNTLLPFDTDGDGTLAGLDRYWRHLYLWFDSDGDRKPANGEMVSPFEYKIREIDLDLRSFVAGRGKKASRGEIETDQYILVDAKQDGFRATLYPAGDDAALAVDADALRRDPGGLEIRDRKGAEVTGIQPFVRGWTIIDRDGVSIAIDCPG